MNLTSTTRDPTYIFIGKCAPCKFKHECVNARKEKISKAKETV